jgi:methionine salvage enolase-phosphatase E1
LTLTITMKLPLLFLFTPLATAFVVRTPVQLQTTTIRKGRVDSSDAVAEAQRICDEKGIHSAECALAFEVVEEMDSAYHPSLEIQADVSSECEEYADMIHGMATILQQTQEKLLQMKHLAERLSQLEQDHPSVVKLGKLPANLKLALAEAKAVDDIYGPNSEQSETAWQIVQEAHNDDLKDTALTDIQGETQHANARYKEAALKGHHHDYNTVIDPDSLKEAIDGIGRIQHLSRLVELEKERVQDIMDLC